MIRKLRLRFLRIVMEAFSVVLVLVLVGLNLVNARSVYGSIDRRLVYLAESGMGPPLGMMENTPPLVRGWVDLNSAGIMNETNYFIFSGYMTESIREQQLALLSSAAGLDAADLLNSILAGDASYGNAGPYRYYAASRDTPYLVVFQRCESEFAAMRSLLRTSVLVGLTSLGLVLLVAALLSGRAIRPFAENIENQKRFISNASHELKTPLGVIMSDLDLQILESGETEWLTNAQAQADHLRLLIEQLTAYSLLTENGRRDSVPVDLSALGQELLSDFRPLALSREQVLSADIEPDIVAAGDRDALRTLLSVLMDNAVKYTPAGGDIHLSLRREKRIVIQLKNTCADTSDMDLRQLFERFYRAPEHRADQTGHGLGLSIAADIAALYGGTIRAEAEGGSVIFTAELPA